VEKRPSSLLFVARGKRLDDGPEELYVEKPPPPPPPQLLLLWRRLGGGGGLTAAAPVRDIRRRCPRGRRLAGWVSSVATFARSLARRLYVVVVVELVP